MTQKHPERYAAICEASPDAIFLVDSTGNIHYANARVEDMFGYEPAELIGEPIEILVPEPLRDEHVQLRNEYLAAPETRPMGASLDLKAQRKDGSTFPVDISLSPISADGEAQVMASVRDISDKENLRRKYQSILKAIPDPVIVADTGTGKIVETNQQTTELFGYDPEELIGKPQTVLHPAGEEERYRALFQSHVEAGGEIFTELPDGSNIYIETKSWELIPVEINAREFEHDDQRLIAGVFRDISTRQEHERQLEELHEASRQFYQAESQEEIADQVARATEAILGFERTVVRLLRDGDQLRPVSVTDLAQTSLGPRPDYQISTDNFAGQAYQNGEPLVIDNSQDAADADSREDIGSALYLPIGEYGVLSIVDPREGAFDPSDVQMASIVAANARAAFERLEIQEQLEHQIERLDKFARIVSHDLRNPLSVAKGWLDVAIQEENIEVLQRVRKAHDRMEEIIEDTLTLAQSGEVVGATEPIELEHLAGDCWNHVATVDAHLEIEDSRSIYGDRDRLQHLLENLFRNAIEHGGDDSRVKIGLIGESGFYVEDDGPGIPEDQRDNAFEPGFTTSSTGTGFGLSIVKEVAEAHGWDITLTEGSDGGARFEFIGINKK